MGHKDRYKPGDKVVVVRLDGYNDEHYTFLIGYVGEVVDVVPNSNLYFDYHINFHPYGIHYMKHNEVVKLNKFYKKLYKIVD